MLLSAAAGALVGLLLSGCAARRPVLVDVEQEATASPEIALQRSLTRVGKAMRDLEATRSGARPVVPPELQLPVSWKWTGPMDGAARALAAHIGYAFVPPAAGPALPTVTVAAENTPVVDILRSIGTQCGDKATLSVEPDPDPSRRIIRVLRNG